MKHFLFFLSLLLTLTGISQATSTRKVTVVTTKQDWGGVPTQISAIAAILGLCVATATIITKRQGDRRADRLSRINRQLSQLYGKLAILDEAGGRNWLAFVSKHGNDLEVLGREFMRFFPYKEKADEPITFFNPPAPNAEQLKAYRTWLKSLFMKTNEAMLEVIYNNADLVVGQKMPQVFVSFAEHVESLRLLLMKIKEEEKLEEEGLKSDFLSNWQEYADLMAPHPSGSLGYYISASYEVLKEAQETLLSTNSTPPTEKELADRIEQVQWEKADYWCKREYEIRTAAGQQYEYKLVPVPEPKSK
jgi:hypothetical protein